MKPIRIILHGYLKKLYPHEIRLSGSSVAEIINGLCKQTKAFEADPVNGRHILRVLGFDSEDALRGAIDPSIEELHLVPDFSGGKGGVFQVAVGVVLVAAAVISGPAGWAGIGIAGTTLGAIATGIGISLIMGGLLAMLSPAPQLGLSSEGNQSDPEASRYFGSNGNTVAAGTRIPLPYGEHMVYGQFLSFNVTAADVAV